MSASKQPSYVEVNEAEGTATVAYLPSWYHADRCDDCPRYHHLSSSKTEVAFCDLIEKEEPCEITGVRPEGVKK